MATPPDIAALRTEFDAALRATTTVAGVKALHDRFLGRKSGSVTAILKSLAGMTPDEKRQIGRDANELRQAIEAALAEREATLGASAPPPNAVDVTLPGRVPLVGRRHPLTQVRDRVESIFSAMGYRIASGPELEDDWHNFEALNMPGDHPARDMQDTLYLAEPVKMQGARAGGRPATLLRTHTSGVQIRYMESHTPPVRLIAPGRVYRRDNFDATHTPMFTQVEGLVVDEGITLGDLKGTLNAFAERLFNRAVRTRFRPSFFPYTEPSAEMDVALRRVRRRRLRALQAQRVD